MTTQHNIDLAPYTTFRVQSVVPVLITTSSIEDLTQALLEYPHAKVLGGGSNILSVGEVRDPIIRICNYGIEVVAEDNRTVDIQVNAGESWHGFVTWCVEHGYGGLENLALIPGTVGAAPIQNIGAYGIEQNACLLSIQAIERATGIVTTFTNDVCAFGYRTSIFKTSMAGRYIIAAVTYRLAKPPHTVHANYKDVAGRIGSLQHPTIHDVYQAVVAIRKSKLPDPSVLGNAGSFFKNPVISTDLYTHLVHAYPNLPSYPIDEHNVKVPAAWLIEHAGWKGFRDGAIGVHDHQALVIVNYGGGTGQQVLDLAARITDSVAEKYQIKLDIEVNVW